MGRVQGVADKNAISDRPMLVVNDWELPPGRLVRYQLVAIQCLRKHAFTEAACLFLVHLPEARAREGGSIDLDNERR